MSGCRDARGATRHPQGRRRNTRDRNDPSAPGLRLTTRQAMSLQATRQIYPLVPIASIPRPGELSPKAKKAWHFKAPERKSPAVSRGALIRSRIRSLLDDRSDDAGAVCKSRLRAICTLFCRRQAYAIASDRYSTIEATMPAPTVRPPSRIAKRSFSSIAIGTISSTSTVTLSPGITISVPSGSVTMPVTSVVRK